MTIESHNSLSQDANSRGVFWLALATTVATFPLICMGGLVTSHHAGMSVPDWPNSYGYNMFLFPPNRWIGGIFYEHTHRLMGTVVGMLSIALVVWSWAKLDRARYLALIVLGAVIFQGVLGGLRVVLVKLNLAIVHACVAQAFFCLCAYVTLVTSRWWNESKSESNVIRSKGLIMLGVITVTAIYAQLMVGATMRHFDAGLAIPDLPLAYGKWLPPMTDEALTAINHHRAFDLSLDPVTLTQVWLHFGHRIGAAVVSILVLVFAIQTLQERQTKGLDWAALILVGLLLSQVTLGVLTVLLRKPADIASAHVAVGALVLVTAFVLTARIVRLSRRSRSTEAARTPSGFEIQRGRLATG